MYGKGKIVSEIFEQGEYQLGSYRVQFAHMTNTGWSGTGPWMRAILTNRRFLLIPVTSLDNTDKPQKATIIHLADVAKVWMACLGLHSGIMLTLNSGHHLHLFVDWSEGRRMMREMQASLANFPPRISPRHAH